MQYLKTGLSLSISGKLHIAEREYQCRQDEIARLRQEADEKKAAAGRLEKQNEEFKTQFLIPLLRQYRERMYEEANLGDSHAQWEMGWAYAKGMYGIEPNMLKAAEWYRKSAAQGHPMALGALGAYYDLGVIGGKVDTQMAIALWQRAVEGGEVIAMAELGVCYWNGEGVKEDASKARELWGRGADMGDKLCRLRLCPQYEATESLIFSCQECTSGLVIEEVADMYARGYGLPQDWAAAAIWYERAANMHRSAHAWFQLHCMFDEGRGVAKDEGKALYCLQQAAHGERIAAQYELAKMYECGKGVEKDICKAINWYTRAARRGHLGAQRDLAMCLAERGWWMSAIRWCKTAASRGNSVSQYNLFLWHSQGRTNGLLDQNTALHWYSNF